jgi:hypothetical protein
LLSIKGLAIAARKAQISVMATMADSGFRRQSKATVLGRSAATGRLVLAPAAAKRGMVSEQRLTAVVKSVLDKKK